MNDQLPSDDRLALEGGEPLRTSPLPPWPVFDDEQIEAAAAVLRGGKVNYWTGRQGRQFENEFAEQAGCRYGVAVANGSVALELALCALEIGPGDEVVVPSRSFIATASACVMRGAAPIFADIDRESQNLTAETIREVLTPRTRAIIAVHLAGWPCEMDPITALADEHRLLVIEDCAQAHGATYRGRSVGSFGHAAAFSFCQDKIITTGGEGGMLTTNDHSVWRRAWSYKDHGKSWEAVQRPDASSVFQWVHESFGTNWRMTEMQAAIGRATLGKLDGWVAARRKHAAMLDRRLGNLPQLRLAVPPEHVGCAYYKHHVFLRKEQLRAGWSRDRVVRAVQAEGIPCGSGMCAEIYLEKAFQQASPRGGRRLPVARELGQTSLMFQVHPTLTERDLADTCRAVEKVLRVAAVDTPATIGKAA